MKRVVSPRTPSDVSAPRRLADVDLRLLRVFRTVANCGGLAASEVELNIGRSTISRHLADLESRLGVTVCRRGPGGFALTDEGVHVLKATDRLMGAIDVFRGEIQDLNSSLTGTLRLACFDLSSDNPRARIDAAIGDFERRAPAVVLELGIESPDTIAAGLESGRVDVGVVPLHGGGGTAYERRVLYDEAMVLCCGARHALFDRIDDPALLAELPAHKHAGFEFRSPGLRQSQQLGLRTAARVQTEEALCVLILSGRYTGFLPDHVAARFIAAGRMRTLYPTETGYTTTLAAIARRRPPPGRRTSLFLDCLSAAHAPR